MRGLSLVAASVGCSTLLVLTEVSGVLLYTFHALNNLIIANMLEVGTIFSPVQMRK